LTFLQVTAFTAAFCSIFTTPYALGLSGIIYSQTA